MFGSKEAIAIAGSEFPHLSRFITRNDLTLFLSQSGETIDVVEPARFLNKKGFPTAALVNRVGSTLDRIVDYSFHLKTGPEICVLSTKVFTAKLAILLLLSASFGKRKRETSEFLQKAILASRKILSENYRRKYIIPLVKRLKTEKHIYLIGRGLSYPLALEAALKIKESTYIHAEGFAAGELKHGVLALISKNTPCFVFAPKDESYDSTVSNAIEIKARGGYVINVASQKTNIFDFVLPVDDCGPAVIIPNIIAVQLLSYYLTVELGNDPDKPRNLAKSVTVK